MEPAGIAQLELRLAGVFGVVRDGVPLPDGELGSRKARTLLKLLAVERARLLAVDQIAEVLWAGNPPQEPMQHVATLVSRLRRRGRLPLSGCRPRARSAAGAGGGARDDAVHRAQIRPERTPGEGRGE